MKSFNPTSCDPYWEEVDWLPPWYILDRWCQRDEACIQAKLQALLSACERGDVQYRRSDGKTYDDPVHELSTRGKLLINRQSFNQWCSALEGKTPLAGGMPAVVAPAVPSWAHQHRIQAPTARATVFESEPSVVAISTPVKNAKTEAMASEADAPDSDGDLPVEELRKRAVTADDIIQTLSLKTAKSGCFSRGSPAALRRISPGKRPRKRARRQSEPLCMVEPAGIEPASARLP